MLIDLTGRGRVAMILCQGVCAYCDSIACELGLLLVKFTLVTMWALGRGFEELRAWGIVTCRRVKEGSGVECSRGDKRIRRPSYL